ncbi:MAG: iron ABC transporter permease [Clostridia bacterium]|nr:iron ABC transporter permease [Clostridia bacterium]
MEKWRHFKMKRRAYLWLAALMISAPFLLLIGLSIGSASISPGEIIRQTGLYLQGKAVSASAVILFSVRLPRLLLAFLVGAGLSVSGVSMQGIFQNPMADPHLLGVSSGAALGATIAIIMGAPRPVQIALAFCGGLAAVALSHVLAFVNGRTHRIRLLLAGIAVSSLLSAAVSALMMFNKAYMDRIVHWTMGSLTTANRESVGVAAILLIPMSLASWFFARALNAIALGDDEAKALGISVSAARICLIGLSTLMTAAAVSITGIIGFVGLVIPHSVRLLTGGNHRSLFPLSFFTGGLFLMLCDTAARTLAAPVEIPVGVITALIGGSSFLLLMRRSAKRALER